MSCFLDDFHLVSQHCWFTNDKMNQFLISVGRVRFCEEDFQDEA
jgi:hypothetical protein